MQDFVHSQGGVSPQKMASHNAKSEWASGEETSHCDVMIAINLCKILSINCPACDGQRVCGDKTRDNFSPTPKILEAT